MGSLPAISVLRRRGRRDIKTFAGSLFFVGGGVVTLVGLVVPHPPELNEPAYLVLAAAMISVGIFLVFLPQRLVRHTPPVAVGVGIAATTLAVAFNGEVGGGPPLLNETFYIWPTLYVGYFLSRRLLVGAMSLTAACYAAALHYMHVPLEQAGTRFTAVTMGLTGVAVVAHALRLHVDRLVRRLHSLARTDSLTGLLNRRAFDERLAEELARSRRTHEPFALLLGDVDHFKSINDRRGHAMGDRALAYVGELLSEGSRTVDTVARVGGEEFALLLPATDIEGGLEAAERLLAAVRAQQLDGEALTMCFGVVESERDGHTPDDLLRAADRALYEAKQRGRDRAIIALGGER